jgi:ATP adenylyltransferase
MERLWTPWRKQYISKAAEPLSGCLFCELPKQTNDAENLLLRRGERCFSLLNLYPYNSGHAMVAPYQHSADFEGLAPEIAADVFAEAQRLVTALRTEYHPHGFNLGLNLGQAAGAGIPDHLHLHVVPRWSGDANFMPLLADTKVLPESLQQTYARLRRVLTPE